MTGLLHFVSFFYKLHPEVTSKVDGREASTLFKIKAFPPNPLLKDYVTNYEIWSKKAMWHLRQAVEVTSIYNFGTSNIWSLTFSDSSLYIFCSEPLFS